MGRKVQNFVLEKMLGNSLTTCLIEILPTRSFPDGSTVLIEGSGQSRNSDHSTEAGGTGAGDFKKYR